MIKTIILDADGVVLNRPMMFSERYSREFNIPYDKILPFFENDFVTCIKGQADLKEKIKPYLADWRWNKSVDELLAYWFQNEHFVDEKLIAYIKKLKENYAVYLATDQEKYRAKYITDKMGLAKIFNQIFFSCDLGYRKREINFWRQVYASLSCAKNEIFFGMTMSAT